MGIAAGNSGYALLFSVPIMDTTKDVDVVKNFIF